MPEGGRQDEYRLTVTIDDQDWGIWDKLSGGEVDSDETKYRPGGLAPEVSLGGQVSVGNVTISRLFTLGRDHPRIKNLFGKVGKAQCVVKKQPLDADGNAFDEPIVYRGKLKTVNTPDVDSESSDAALVELEVSTSGTVG